METLKIGSRGSIVKELQANLNKLGNSLVVDGHFGNATEDAVIAFQKKHGLTPDGIVGVITFTKIKNLTTTTSEVKPAIVINKTKYVLTTKNYFQQEFVKKSVVLHHTNGWTVQKGSASNAPSMNHFHGWAATDRKVSTAYSIDYAGNIFEHFDPKFWAYHLGIGGKYAHLDKSSIGIELVNEGAMRLKDDKWYWVTGMAGTPNETLVPYNRMSNGLNDVPVHVKDGWRGYEYFAPYSKAQVEATLWLCQYLLDKFKISKNFINHCNYQGDILTSNFSGIYNHANVRPSGKWDLSPAFPFEYFQNNL